jgi:excisionase family DNA binding protein
MIDNPFAVLERRLNRLEFLLLEIKETHLHPINNNKHSDGLLTIDEAAKLLTLAVPTLYGMVGRREIPFCKKGKRLYFIKQELTEWVHSGRKQTASEIKKEAVISSGMKRRG